MKVLRKILGAPLALLPFALLPWPTFLLAALGQRRAAAALVRFAARVFMRAFGVRIVVSGEEHLPVGGFVAAAAHTSMLDTFLYPGLLPLNTIYVAKKELARLPLYGAVFRKLGYVYVDRGGNLGAVHELERAVAELKGDVPIFIHPEGTRSRGGAIGKLRIGFAVVAVTRRVPVVPIVAQGGETVWPRGKLLPYAGEVHLHYGPPIETVHWSWRTLAAHVEESKARLEALRSLHQDSPCVTPEGGVAVGGF